MKTKRRNAAACLTGWAVAFVPLQWFVGQTAEAFDLSNTALYVLSFLGGVMLGAITGYVYLELEARRMRLERERRDRAFEERVNLQQWTWRRQ